MAKIPDFDPEDVLLLILEANQRLLGRSRLSGITRLEKLIFLLEKEGGAGEIKEKFEFSPHNFGPFSAEVYNAKDFLRGIGLINEESQPLASYYAGAAEMAIQNLTDDAEEELPSEAVAHEKVFELTDLGRKAASNLRSDLQKHWPQLVQGIDRVVSKYGDLPLNQIIRYVYQRYPETTTKSVHPEARRVRARAG